MLTKARKLDPIISVAICANAKAIPAHSDRVCWSIFEETALAKHLEQPQKDGLAFIFAELHGGRCDHNVESVSCLAYDIDGKLTVAEVSAAVSATGLEAVLYTTYNHLKTQTTVGAKSFRTYAKAYGLSEAPTDLSMQAFCAATPKYDHLRNIQIANGGETVRVNMYASEFDAFIIDHDPEHKTRVIIPLAQPIPLQEVGKDGYKAIYHAVGQELFGHSYDAACCNPARLNYAPSCRPGSTGHVIQHHEAR